MQPSSQERSWFVFPSRRFSGTLSFNHRDIPIQFDLAVDATGTSSFSVDVLPMNRDTISLVFDSSQPGDHVAEFSVVATSEDGWTFRSERMSLGRSSQRNTTEEASVQIGLRCAVGTLSNQQQRTEPEETLVFRLKGFAGFGPLNVSHALGDVVARGTTNPQNCDTITGFVAATRPGPTGDPDWRTRAEELLRHVNHVLGFTRGAPLRIPIVEYYTPQACEVTLHSTTEGCSSFLPPFNDLNLDPIFRTAVSSFDTRNDAGDLLDLAIGWFMLPTTYDAVRYLSAMTALESLVQDDAGQAQTTILDSVRFRTLRGSLSEMIDNNDSLSEQERNGLRSKLGDLNRLSLREKLQNLAAAWRVPLDGFPPNAIGALIGVRNDIVHRGEWRYDGDLDIWEHLIRLRELVTRFILAALRFEGQYQSYMDSFGIRPFLLTDTPSRAS